jgi:hypothetical protein
VGEFADSVTPRLFKVQNPPDYVFLCGGKLEDPEHSLRAQFYERKVKPNPVLEKKVVLAEVADKWYSTRKLFGDLLELEGYLAALCACILLFVESPGAIAELGAFTQMAALREKLIAVIERSHSIGPSFIVNGPIEQMSRLASGRVLSYPWLLDPSGADPKRLNIGALDDTLNDLIEKLQETLAKRTKTSGFRAKDHGHRMLLIADLVKLSVVTFQEEIQEILGELRVGVGERELTKYLYLLNQLGLIATEKYGHIWYYFGVSGTPEFIRYAPKTPMDRIKLADRLHADFPIGTDTEKRRALNAHTPPLAGGAR